MPLPTPIRLLIRADASPRIGFGHLARCLAIAEAVCEKGGEVAFATRTADPHTRGWREGWSVYEVPGKPDDPVGDVDIAETERLAREWSARWALVDHYGAPNAYLERLKGAGTKVAVIDDTRARTKARVDLVLSFHLGASGEGYGEADRVVAGTEYLPVRRAIVDAREASLRRDRSRLQRVVVLLGGSDSRGIGESVVRELDRLLPASVIIRWVVGPAAERPPSEVAVDGGPSSSTARPERWAAGPESRGQVLETSGPRLRPRSARPTLGLTGLASPSRESTASDVRSARIERVGPFAARDLAREMVEADAAVATPSMVFWELATLGVPAAVIPVADNQVSADRLASCGAARVVSSPAHLAEGFEGPSGLLVPDVRQRVGRTASRLLDGSGAVRIAEELARES